MCKPQDVPTAADRCHELDDHLRDWIAAIRETASDDLPFKVVDAAAEALADRARND